MNVLGILDVTSARTARSREADRDARTRELEDCRADRGALEQALDRLREADRPPPPPSARRAPEGPPAVAHELITLADRLVDLAGNGAPTDPEGSAAALRWVRDRVAGLLALCEVAPISDDGLLDFMRHEVVADRPAPSLDLVDHIADTVRPGYLWRHDLLRAQQVVAYVAGTET